MVKKVVIVAAILCCICAVALGTHPNYHTSEGDDEAEEAGQLVHTAHHGGTHTGGTVHGNSMNVGDDAQEDDDSSVIITDSHNHGGHSSEVATHTHEGHHPHNHHEQEVEVDTEDNVDETEQEHHGVHHTAHHQEEEVVVHDDDVEDADDDGEEEQEQVHAHHAHHHEHDTEDEHDNTGEDDTDVEEEADDGDDTEDNTHHQHHDSTSTTHLDANDWRVAGCKAKTTHADIFNACLDCVHSLPDDNMDFGCFDWCAAYAKSEESMRMCSSCLLEGFTNKAYKPWGCNQCIIKSHGEPKAHAACVNCLSDVKNEYYCLKALEVCSGDVEGMHDVYSCLEDAKNEHHKLESCINNYRRRKAYRRLRS